MPTNKINAACQSFLALCIVLDELLKLKYGRGSSSQHVLGLLSRFLGLHKAFYGIEWIKPKHHFAFHNILSLDSDKVFLDCFVHERKHQIVKRAGTAIKNTKTYESSVLGRVLFDQWRQLQGSKLGNALVGVSETNNIFRSTFGEEVRIAHAVQYDGLVIECDDLLLVRHSSSAYIVRACVFLEVSLKFVVVGEELGRVSMASAHSSYRPQHELHALSLDGSLEVSMPYCWTWQSDNEVVILHPAA